MRIWRVSAGRQAREPNRSGRIVRDSESFRSVARPQSAYNRHGRAWRMWRVPESRPRAHSRHVVRFRRIAHRSAVSLAGMLGALSGKRIGPVRSASAITPRGGEPGRRYDVVDSGLSRAGRIVECFPGAFVRKMVGLHVVRESSGLSAGWIDGLTGSRKSV